MSKKNKTALTIFTESVGLYFSNFNKFIKYMTFPVLGQIGGISLVFLLTYYFAKHMPTIIEKINILNNITTILAIMLLLILPGLLIFIKAFWEYLVAYGAINSMLENMLKSGKVYDFDAHTELIKRRSIPFIGLWFLFGIYSLIALSPLMWIICGVFAIFFVLVFQVFTYEPEQTPIGCAKRSLQLIKGNFSSTFLLFALVGALTYILIPKIFETLFNYTHITLFLANCIKPFIEFLPINEWNSIIAQYNLKTIEVNEIANLIINTTIALIIIQYTLPLRSILWAIWYKELNGGHLGNKDYENKSSSKKTKANKKVKKPSEKLMTESNKKFSSKKLDRNILKRALEKDDE